MGYNGCTHEQLSKFGKIGALITKEYYKKLKEKKVKEYNK